LRAQATIHELMINPVIYAELSLSFSSLEALGRAVAGMQLTMREIPRPALFLAGKAFLQYRNVAARKRRCCPTSSSARTPRWSALRRGNRKRSAGRRQHGADQVLANSTWPVTLEPATAAKV
jgi:hypothetical protein